MSEISPAATMRAVFDALGSYDIEKLMSYWAENSSYDNPMVGQPVEGKAAVRSKLEMLIEGLQDRGERLVVERTTEEPGRTVVEWHVEPGDGSRRGVHVAEVGDDGLVSAVTVYPRL